MNNQNLDKRVGEVMKGQKIFYFFFWALLLLLFVLGSNDTFFNGLFAHQAMLIYLLETGLVLITAAVIPLSLKLFNSKISTAQKSSSSSEVIEVYNRWSYIRLASLFVVALFGIVIHYLCVSSAAGLCTLLICFAALFCIPSKKKLNFALRPLPDSVDEQREEKQL